MSLIRWGIIGTGSMSLHYAKQISILPNHQIVAVGSRSTTRAKDFADKLSLSVRCTDLETMARSKDVDVVYIASPNTCHFEHATYCMEMGRNVLIEKPIAMSLSEAESIVKTARNTGRFCMEAMWTRFSPIIKQLEKTDLSARLGNNIVVNADLGFDKPFDRNNRLFNPKLGGGALLDLGVYSISLMTHLFGAPNRIESSMNFCETGVDIETTIELGFPNGVTGHATNSLNRTLRNGLHIKGSDAELVATPIYMPTQLSTGVSGELQNSTASKKPIVNRAMAKLQSILRRDSSTTKIETQIHDHQFQAIEVERCLAQGALESSTMPLDDSLLIMKIVDVIKIQSGLNYAELNSN